MVPQPHSPRTQSPLTRGKLVFLLLRFGGLGLIPAHAGKTTPTRRPWCGSSAHPRSRGENSRAWSSSWMRTGSSPLTRGKHFSDAHFAALSRLIPAHAGKTRTRLARALSSTAHPRSRGENVSQRAGRWYASGSSPLTRGKPAGTSSITRMEGLIPAHAGKTHEGRTRRDDLEAHPRSRGENTPAALSRVKVNGSSPLTRGKLDVLSADHPERRLIPAHAGKTCICGGLDHIS